MSSILMKGIVRNGRVEVDEPISLPDGTEVVVTPRSAITEDDDRMTPEEIAATLAAMEKSEPFVWTKEERAAWEAERQARKEWEKAHFQEHAEKLRRT